MKSLRHSPLRQAFANATNPQSWSSLPSFLPHSIRRKFRSSRSKLRSRAAPASSLSKLTYSFSPLDTIESLRTHQWTIWDLQYLLFALIGIYALCIIKEPGPLVKGFLATLLLTALSIPITRQFFLPFLGIISWLVGFYASQFVPPQYRPPIWVKVLPALENIFYGANLSNILSAHKSSFLTVLAWLPYGITHFGAPAVCSLILFIFGPPGMTPIFARTFGFMNIFGVTIQLLFPCSPPWYENMYGLAPANYSIQGSPAGLAAVDKIFGINLYTSTFTASPLVFGAFPSLHAGSATVEALFMSLAFPKLRPLFILYALWLCWATMYLSHHYAIDLVGGSLLATVCYLFAKAKFIPRVQQDKLFRWDYDYVETGEPQDHTGTYNSLPSNSIPSFAVDYDYNEEYAFRAQELGGLDGAGRRQGGDADDWTLSMGSSSSYSQASSSTAGLGDRSPVERLGKEDAGSDAWEGDTLAGGSDVEKR